MVHAMNILGKKDTAFNTVEQVVDQVRELRRQIYQAEQHLAGLTSTEQWRRDIRIGNLGTPKEYAPIFAVALEAQKKAWEREVQELEAKVGIL